MQTHPDDAYARQLGDAFGKEEVWQVLKASNDAKIYLGFEDLMTPESFKDAVTSEQFLSHLNTFDAHVGDTYHIPAGVIHALGAGTKVYEASTASERTFRVYDYGRGRELHLDDALKVLRFDEDGKGLKKVSNILRAEEGYVVSQLLKGEQLELRLFTVHGRGKVVTGACLLTCLQGPVTLKSSSAEVSLAPTDTVLVPACIENLEIVGEGEFVCANFKLNSASVDRMNLSIPRSSFLPRDVNSLLLFDFLLLLLPCHTRYLKSNLPLPHPSGLLIYGP